MKYRQHSKSRVKMNAFGQTTCHSPSYCDASHIVIQLMFLVEGKPWPDRREEERWVLTPSPEYKQDTLSFGASLDTVTCCHTLQQGTVIIMHSTKFYKVIGKCRRNALLWKLEYYKQYTSRKVSVAQYTNQHLIIVSTLRIFQKIIMKWMLKRWVGEVLRSVWYKRKPFLAECGAQCHNRGYQIITYF